jgi:hypothetical protein
MLLLLFILTHFLPHSFAERPLEVADGGYASLPAGVFFRPFLLRRECTHKAPKTQKNTKN